MFSFLFFISFLNCFLKIFYRNENSDITCVLGDHVRITSHVNRLKVVVTLSEFYSGDISWFTISTDPDDTLRVFCHLCNDSKGRRIKSTISSFTKQHCNEDHKRYYSEWKGKHPLHPFQKNVNLKPDKQKQLRNLFFLSYFKSYFSFLFREKKLTWFNRIPILAKR